MRKLTHRIWAGIGVAALVSAPVTSPQAQHGGHDKKDKASTAQDAGVMATPQSGEAYLTDGGPKDTRVRVYRDLALIRGHLLVGGELIEQGLWEDALPHFLHPTEELYGGLERYIKLHKITPFDRQLKQLAQAVKARNKNAYVQASKVVDERLSGALSGFKRFMTGAPFSSFTARTVSEMLNVAKEEYASAIEAGRFAKPVEYQDGRGFVRYAEQLLTAQAKDFEAIDRLAYSELRRLLDEIKTAWPTVAPPEKVPLSQGELANKIDTFAKQASRYF